VKSHAIGFENRWTSGEHAREWVCELERLGLPTVRVMFADHETHHADAPKVVFDIPPGFVRDWLAYHDRRIARSSCSGALASSASVSSPRPRQSSLR
jgi:hypothetical protein